MELCSRKLTNVEKKIVEDNINLIYAFCKKQSLDVDEYYDILAIELCKCVMVWDKTRKLSVLAYKAFKNAVYSQWRYNTTKKRDYRKKVSLANNKTDYGYELDIIDYAADVESGIIAQDICEIVNKNKIWVLYVQGYSRKEISKILDISVRSVGLAINKLKMEVESYYEKRD